MFRFCVFLMWSIVSVQFYAVSQIIKPIKWEFEIDSSDYSTNKKNYLVFKPTIELGWYLYSSDNDPNSGPYTIFEFDKNETYKLNNSVIPLNVKTKYDSVWNSEVRYLDKGGFFKQEFTSISKDISISGFISYQVCSEIEKMCIPLETEFSFYNQPNQEKIISENTNYNTFGKNESLISFILFSFLAGFLAILTPCVFPMIPITVSFFTNKKNNSKVISEAVFYGASIILIFTFLGIFLSLLIGPQTANEIATAWIPNTIFFVLFILFGLSLIGFFEIRLPSNLITSIDKKSEQGGYLGIFFMALTLVLVSFSCTGPLVGSILVQSASGLKIKPILGMLAFSTAFALPFTLLAVFPNKLHSLPKSGNWMIILKVILGFIVIAFSFKFLSVIDKAYHINIMSRDLFLACWSFLFLILTLYLVGIVKLPEGYVKSKRITTRILGLVFFILSSYIISGIFGNRLPYLAAYLPPQQSTYFDIYSFTRKPFYSNDTKLQEDYGSVKYSDILELPHNMNGFFDYNEAKEYAQKTNKPMLLDFTGHGCVNCRDIEARVWSDEKVRDIINNKYVLVSLYVDDKTLLPEQSWFISQYDGRIKKTIGKQNADFQITRFNNNAQPYYLVINPFSEEIVYQPWGYELNVKKYIDNLNKGILIYYGK